MNRKAVSIDDLSIGEVLAQDIYDQDQKLLLRKGTVLLGALVEAFRKRNLLEVYIMSAAEPAPPEAAPVPMESDVEPRMRMDEAETFRAQAESPAENLTSYAEMAEQIAFLSTYYSRLQFEMRRAALRGQYNKIMPEDLPEAVGRMTMLLSSGSPGTPITFYMQIKDLYPDYNFEAHSVNVAMLSAMIGIWMGLNDFEIKELALGGLLHDIGETQIPPAIFAKKGRLTESEWSILKTHPLLSAKIINKNKWSTPKMITSVLRHHERLDGTGYPYGSPGSEIPLYARIIAAAESLDAMTTNRAHRQAISLFAALAELRDRSFGQLDAKITRMIYEKVLLHYQGQTVLLSNGDRGTIVSMTSGQEGQKLLIKGDQGYYDLNKKEAPVIRTLCDVSSF